MKLVNGLNSNYPGVSLARFSHSSFFSPPFFLPSPLSLDCVILRYALPHIAKTPDPRKGTEVMAEAEWKSKKRASMRPGSANRAYELYVIAIEMPSLLYERQIILY